MIEESEKGWLLDNGLVAYALRVGEDGVLEHLHFGGSLGSLAGFSAWPRQAYRSLQIDDRGKPFRHLGTLAQELPFFGRGDFRSPAIAAPGLDELVFESARKIEGGLDLGDLPSARFEGAETLQIRTVSRHMGLEVVLSLTLWPGHPVLARTVTVRNISDRPHLLDRASSLSIDLPQADRHIVHLTGSWAREMHLQRHRIETGRFSFGSCRGTSSAQHPPFIALTDTDTTELHGEVLGGALVYSGNHETVVEKDEFGAVRLQMGLPGGMRWPLAPGEAFIAPQALLLHTDRGLGGMSHGWHDFVRERLLPERREPYRPVYLNTWESAYFEVDEDKVEKLARAAKKLGCEMLVLDDGWFKGRRDDHTSLGDWQADPKRFSRGMGELARRVTAEGLKFGLWFEPEMVSRESDLYREHPDWIIGADRDRPGEGRNQLTLDLSRPEVEAHIESVVASMLREADISYVKWDMNRFVSDLDDAKRAHLYMLALYRIVRKLRKAFPGVVFENCASGGNRFDFGMLCLFDQTWTSDLCDPEGRLDIQSGASHFFPLSALASYIGPSPNHQNGRISSFEARRDVAFFCGSRGFSLSAEELEAHASSVKETAGLYTSTQSLVTKGRFDRLRTGAEIIWQLTSPSGDEVVILYARKRSEPNPPFASVRLRNLEKGSAYRMEGSGELWRAESLMVAGLPMPHTDHRANPPLMKALPTGDMATALLRLRRV
ncbi:alpha-galactosidase [Parvularcula maris]|uniref:Alpha-galactosidase n=1 Tax=Parvularcula maris TaxID=2965077 RepID=A0A9X2LAC0_9PROT|nr:alpha-galactosidase [Parvularcula maris]MCQ8186055.1 alpha-galactosidase [Parvularcula maris]